MAQIVFPLEVRQHIRGIEAMNVNERHEVIDEWGNILGYFEPKPNAGGWGPFTAEQVEAAFKQTGPCRTLDEIYREHGGS